MQQHNPRIFSFSNEQFSLFTRYLVNNQINQQNNPCDFVRAGILPTDFSGQYAANLVSKLQALPLAGINSAYRLGLTMFPESEYY